ncbi:hypothetical protein [Pendulispora albinea]|uniref:Uncharacterized protein n=1 Tax=Pendulispora albinea TaxID=2741071 RepID=A0ABZ2LRD5_9BACT
MPRSTGESAIQITVRVAPEWLPRADRIAEEMRQPGFQMTRTTIFRIALAAGLDWLEREAGIEADERKPESIP